MTLTSAAFAQAAVHANSAIAAKSIRIKQSLQSSLGPMELPFPHRSKHWHVCLCEHRTHNFLVIRKLAGTDCVEMPENGKGPCGKVSVAYA
jgi:hypothetical protein